MILDYLQVQSAFQMKVMPGKNGWTFLSKISGNAQLWRWDEEDSRPVQLTFLPDRVVDYSHSPCGTKTVVGMDSKGDERQQLFLLTEEGKVARALTDSPSHFHYLGGWSPCGEKIVWSSNRRHSRCFDIFVQNVETGDCEEVFQYDGRCDPVAWLPDGSGIIFSVQETNIDNALYRLDLQSRSASRLSICNQNARFLSVKLTKDGRGGYLVTDRGEDTMGLCQFTFDSPELECLVHTAGCDIEEIVLSQDERQIAFTTNEGGISTLSVLSLSDQTCIKAEDVPFGVIQSLDWQSGEQLTFTLKSPTMPGDIWTYSIPAQTARRITYIGKSEAIDATLITPELKSFRSFDGLEVPYFYYAKEAAEECPVVVYVHGGPESQIRAEYHPVFQYLANQGFIVAAPNVRGSMGYGRTYVQLDDKRKRMDSVADLAWLAKSLSHLEQVNPHAIGIMGRSYGGFMVLAAMTHYPELWSAGVDIVGISHFRTFLENTGEWRRSLREAEYGSLAEDSDFFEEIAPLNHSDKINAPLLVFHGRNDTRVPVSEAEQLVADMKARGQQVDLHIYEDEGHMTEKLDNHITMNHKITEFFLHHLAKSNSDEE
ncbi:S9 family peptidase [Brevibacillus choshinensis]|uniref:S9 family peptidase n=1 Tax=Brevibacillus choshinensis TaxID=54911 RepID=A0ABX7FWR6_BRECH|nr:S9 family peptidase [Brevibacillus choshinensis]QRG70116.1 S9 family peptidase [Brevibacillus choshinensis]